MKYPIVLSFIMTLSFVSMGQKDPSMLDLKDFLCLKPSSKVFKSNFIDRQTGDSLLFIDTLVMKEVDFRRSDYYCTINQNDTVFLDISLSYFLYGLIGFKQSNLVYAEVFDVKSLKSIKRKSFKPICPRFIAPGIVYDYDEGWFTEWSTIKFTEEDSVVLFNGQKEKCLLAVTVSAYETGQSSDSIWLAQHYGVVKWVRSTGRTEVLVDVLEHQPQKKYMIRKKYN